VVSPCYSFTLDLGPRKINFFLFNQSVYDPFWTCEDFLE
jgi:hypothetical protein